MPKIALTFDDGPHELHTEPLLDVLSKHDVKATFFVQGSMIEKNPELLKKTHDLGHAIGNHTYSHPDPTTISPDELKAELVKTSALIEGALGRPPVLFRPPFGSQNDEVLGLLASMGLKSVLWDVSAEDWRHDDPQLSFEKVVEGVNAHEASGDDDVIVILLHDALASCHKAADKIIECLKPKGFEFCVVSNG